MVERGMQREQSVQDFRVPQSVKQGSVPGQINDALMYKTNIISPTRKMVDNFEQGLDRYLEKKLGAGGDKVNFGQVIGDAMINGVDRFKTKHGNDMKALLGDGFYEKVAPTGFQATLAKIDQILGDQDAPYAKNTTDMNLLRSLKKDIEGFIDGGDVTLGQIATTRTAWLQDLKKPAPGDAVMGRNQATAMRVLNAMSEDLYGNASAINPGKAGTLQRMKGEYAAWIGITEQKWFKNAMARANEGNYTQVVDSILTNNYLASPKLLDAIKAGLGEKGWQGVQDAFATKFYNDARTPDGVLSLSKLQSQIEKNIVSMENVLGEDAAMRASMTRDLLHNARHLLKAKDGSQTAFILANAGQLLSGVAVDFVRGGFESGGVAITGEIATDVAVGAMVVLGYDWYNKVRSSPQGAKILPAPNVLRKSVTNPRVWRAITMSTTQEPPNPTLPSQPVKSGI